MTINTPQQAPAVEAKCQKCGSQAKSVEYDIIGMVITCAICGKCVYMDRNNQPIEEQQKLEKTKTNIQKSDTPVEAAPGTAEIRQGYNLEYQERQPKERSWETAIDEPEESEMEPETNEVEESEMETETSEAEEPKIETITSEAEESKMETITSETEESKMETVTSESKMETVTSESEPETKTNEVEESELETGTSETEESEPETVTNEAEKSEPETVTNEAEESEPETEASETEGSEPETEASETEESEPETEASETEETKRPATSTAGEPKIQNDGCPNCGKPKDLRDIRRFQRTALRQCTACLSWEINPGQKRKPENQDLAIGIGLQMNFYGAKSKEIQEKANLLTGNLHIGRSSMHYWIRRYAKAAIERARKLQVVNSSGDWELDIMSLEYRTQQHYCWSITDSRTQYILATERTSQLKISEELFKMARHAAGHEPHTILISPNMKKNVPGLAKQARAATLIQRSPSEENSDGSMTRLRNGVTKRVESARGEFNQVTMEYVLGALAMSINLFEQSEQLDDQTPAEAAGVETPYRNWEDMVVKTKATNNHAASRDNSSETMAEGQDPAEPVETMAEGQDAAESVETMTGEECKTIAEELREILKELEQHRKSLIREHQQVVRDQQAVQRTMEILNREQPAVNDVSQETAPVA